MFPKGIAGVKDEAAKRWTMLNVPTFHCDPAIDGSNSRRAVIIDFKNKIGLVVGRADYCGVVKKTMFTVMNFLLPEMGELSMHCSANVGARGDGAILFGLSGTGKTTLSADPERELIGDDEHAWTKDGVSNFEDGCYAKLIDLDKEAEPVIAAALSMSGTLIENVPPLSGKKIEELDPQELDLTDGSITENTRFSYPLSCNPNVAKGARGPHPETIVLLTADAFGVLPPVSVLEAKDVMYHFVSGFTAKLAGTEVGVTEPKAAFSACFGAPFMAQKPSVYAKLLAEKMERHEARCILLNTGWSGGAYGVGKRISIKHTRALLDAALRGDLHAEGMQYDVHPVLNLKVLSGRPGRDPEPPQHLAGQGGLRRAGPEAARHVPPELRDEGFRSARRRSRHVAWGDDSADRVLQAGDGPLRPEQVRGGDRGLQPGARGQPGLDRGHARPRHGPDAGEPRRRRDRDRQAHREHRQERRVRAHEPVDVLPAQEPDHRARRHASTRGR
jgi:phosphoenolpyruvate carboxykinase (ATP)